MLSYFIPFLLLLCDDVTCQIISTVTTWDGLCSELQQPETFKPNLPFPNDVIVLTSSITANSNCLIDIRYAFRNVTVSCSSNRIIFSDDGLMQLNVNSNSVHTTNSSSHYTLSFVGCSLDLHAVGDSKDSGLFDVSLEKNIAVIATTTHVTSIEIHFISCNVSALSATNFQKKHLLNILVTDFDHHGGAHNTNLTIRMYQCHFRRIIFATSNGIVGIDSKRSSDLILNSSSVIHIQVAFQQCTIQEIQWFTSGLVLIMLNELNAFESPIVEKCSIVLEDLLITSVNRWKTGGIVFVSAPIHVAEDAVSDYGMLKVELSNITYENSTGRLLSASGGTNESMYGYEYILRDIRCKNVDSSNQGGGIIRVNGRHTNVTIHSIVATNVSCGRSGGVLTLGGTDTQTVIYNITAYNTFSWSHGGVLMVDEKANATVHYLYADGTFAYYHGGVIGVRENGRLVLDTVVARNTWCTWDGGVVGLGDKGITTIRVIDAYNTSCGFYGGVVRVSDNASIVLGNVIVNWATSGWEGGVIRVGDDDDDSTATAVIHNLTVVNAIAVMGHGGVVLVSNGVVNITKNLMVTKTASLQAYGGVIGMKVNSFMFFEGKFSATSTSCAGFGGVFALLGPNATFLSRNSEITISHSRSDLGGGVVYGCNGSVFRLENVALNVNDARSVGRSGGFVNVYRSGIFMIQCKEGGIIRSGTAMPDGGGCLFIEQSQSVSIVGCIFERCDSCVSGDSVMISSRQDVLGDFALVDGDSKLYAENGTSNISNSRSKSDIKQRCDMSVPSTPSLSTTKRASFKSSDNTAATGLLVVAAIGTVATSSEVVVMTQIVESVWQCLFTDENSAHKHPYLSLGKWIEPKSKKKLWDVALILIGTMFVSIADSAVTWRVYFASSPHQANAIRWIQAVCRVGYPGNSLRYHMSMVIPLLSFVEGGSIVLFVLFVVVLVGIHTTCSKELSYSESKDADLSPIKLWLIPQGTWLPRTCTSLGGLFFASYTSSPLTHFWVWFVLGVAVILKVVAIVDAGDQACNTVTFISGTLLALGGTVHILYYKTLMCVRGLSLIRGIRMVGIGAMMCAVGMSPKSDYFVLTLNYFTFVLGAIEIVLNFAVKRLNRIKR